MRHFHKQKNHYHCPIINLDKLWTLVGEEKRLECAAATGKAHVIDLTDYGIFKCLGKGQLPKQPVVVKARYISKLAEKKIKEYHDEVNAKAGIVKLAPGQLPAPKPIAKEIAAGFTPASSNSNSNATHGAKREAKGPVIHVPEEKTIEASNVFSLLSMDDDDGDDEEE